DSRPKADIVIGMGPNGELLIDRLDVHISTYADRVVRVPLDGKLDRLPSILDAIAHFNFHLGRSHSSGVLRGASDIREDDPLKGVTMEMHRLSGGILWDRKPKEDAENLLIDNRAKLSLDEGAPYGIKIVNRSTLDLYPYLFYFDPSDYSIQTWWEPQSKTMNPPLAGCESQPDSQPKEVTIGYGAGGGDPIEFYLSPGAQSDTGFLKLFVTTKWVNMDWISQGSPFDAFHKRRGNGEVQNSGIWGAWTAAITISDC
ncbi:hypothetical protein EW146_g9733, partial [Bondarzewia mesenterica]